MMKKMLTSMAMLSVLLFGAAQLAVSGGCEDVCESNYDAAVQACLSVGPLDIDECLWIAESEYEECIMECNL